MTRVCPSHELQVGAAIFVFARPDLPPAGTNTKSSCIRALLSSHQALLKKTRENSTTLVHWPNFKSIYLPVEIHKRFFFKVGLGSLLFKLPLFLHKWHPPLASYAGKELSGESLLFPASDLNFISSTACDICSLPQGTLVLG